MTQQQRTSNRLGHAKVRTSANVQKDVQKITCKISVSFSTQIVETATEAATHDQGWSEPDKGF